MPQTIAPLNDTERWIVSSAVKERYGRVVDIQDVETEIRLYVDDRELTLCPGFYWNEQGCHFVLSKTGDARYRSMFFYRIRDRFSTGREEYDDIGDCVTTLLKMQADEAAKRLAESEMSGHS
ncbi:MAG: hypothetical protein ABL877_06895 [Thiobacillus sp.]